MHTVITHSGGFHADDVFAVATLQLLLGKENVQVVRTRDEDVIASGEYAVDVGSVYDHEKKRYDHHQPGAPVRENGIPYAGFGLIWKHFGTDVCGDEHIARAIDAFLVQPVDAGDNGVSLYGLKRDDVTPVELFHVISSFAPAWGSGDSKDDAFLEAVDFARTFLSRTIQRERARLRMDELIKDVYDKTENKAVLVFDVPVRMPALIHYQDVQLIVCPDDPSINDNWTATCVRKSFDSFESRVSFPLEWSGLREEQLQKVSGIKDAVFCHKARFLFVARSKDSVLEAARYAK